MDLRHLACKEMWYNRRKLPYKYLPLFKKRVHVPQHIITQSSWLLGGTSEPNRGNYCHYSQCYHFFRQLSRLSTRLVSSSQHVHSLTKDPAIFRAPRSFATPSAKIPLCEPDLSPKNFCRNFSPPDCSSCSANKRRTKDVTRHW